MQPNYQPNLHNMDSYSGIIIEENRRSEQFSDFTPIPCKGFNLLCKAKRYGRWWVLKGLKKQYRQDENYKNLLHKEFDILISLQHPNIVSAYSMEEIPEIGTCIVMEWIDGITMEHWNGRKTEGEGIFLQLLDAVHYIHAKQIVHRDLKPSNIMITHNGNHVKLIDFGLSDTDDFDILKQPAGTPGYISPEQIISRQADIRNDIFSIGCILEKILPGKAYTAIIKRCKAPIAQRYANVDELKDDFVARRNSHPGIKRTIIAALACIILLGFISYPLLHQQEKRTSPTPAHTEAKKETSRQQASNAAPLSENKQSQQPVAAEPSSTSQTQGAELLSKGKKAIDKMWKESGIDTIRSAETKSKAFYQFVDKSNDFITTTYPQTFSKDITGNRKTDIIYELSSYTTERYIRPTLSSFQSSR